jgi:predicted O-methyltransferase YrrM
MSGFNDVQEHSKTYDDILKDFFIPNRGHHYGVDGWFNFEQVYIDMVNRFERGLFVEIGCWKGRSTIFMADQIKSSGKDIKFFATDLWEPFRQEDGILFHSTMEEFLNNIEPVKEMITVIKGSSHETHKQFEDASIDFLFIDANHDYEMVIKDIQFWLPKVKPHGVIAGHDYQFNGVRKAVDEMFMGRINLKYYESTSSWFVDV